MRAKHFMRFNSTKMYGDDLARKIYKALAPYNDSCCSFWAVIMLLLVHGSLLLSVHVGFGLVPSCMVFFVSFLDARDYFNCIIAVMCYSFLSVL